MRRLFVALFMVFALAAAASASPIVVSGSSAWSTNYTGAFFNNPSWDGAGCNVGNYISGTGGCAQSGFYNGSPAAALPFLGTGLTEFLFSAAPNTSVLLTGVSAHTDEFGWFNSSDGIYHTLFNNRDSLNTSASFTPTGNYGLYFLDSATGARWRSDMLGDSQSHFALFNGGNGTYYLGMEDLRGPLPNVTDFDYNDAVVKLTAQPVPEPGSMVLMGTGLFFLASRVRKWGVRK